MKFLFSTAVVLGLAAVVAAAPSASFHCEYNQDFHAMGGPGGSTQIGRAHV